MWLYAIRARVIQSIMTSAMFHTGWTVYMMAILHARNMTGTASSQAVTGTAYLATRDARGPLTIMVTR